MNIFGLEIRVAGKENGYIRISECQRQHELVDKKIDDLKDHIDIRFTDLMFWLKNEKK